MEPYIEAAYNPLSLSMPRPERAPPGTQSILLPESNPKVYPITAEISQLPGTPNPTTAQNTANPMIYKPTATVNAPIMQLPPQEAQSMGQQQIDPETLRIISSMQQRLASESPLLLPQGISQSRIPRIYGNQMQALSNGIGTIPTRRLISSPPGLLLPQGINAPIRPFLNAQLSGNVNNTTPLGQSLIPTARQLASVIGYQQLLLYLNQAYPQVFPASFIQFGNRGQLLNLINSLGANAMLPIFLQLPAMEKAQVFLAMGLATTLGQALAMAEGMQYEVPFSNAVVGATKKRPQLVSASPQTSTIIGPKKPAIAKPLLVNV